MNTVPAARCKLCGEAKKLGKSHVIPAAFFKAFIEEKKAAMIVSGTPGQFPKRSRDGVYDQTILCHECEKCFQLYDEYAAKIFVNQSDRYFRPVETLKGAIGFQADDIDQKLLLRFLISVLWRASVSSDDFFSRVDLGPYESIAAQVIQQPELDIPPSFGACLSRWEDNNVVEHQIIMDPFREKLGGVNAYRLYLGQFVAYVRVDRQNFGAPFNKFALLSNPQVLVISRSFIASKDRLAMVSTALLAFRK